MSIAVDNEKLRTLLIYACQVLIGLMCVVIGVNVNQTREHKGTESGGKQRQLAMKLNRVSFYQKSIANDNLETESIKKKLEDIRNGDVRDSVVKIMEKRYKTGWGDAKTMESVKSELVNGIISTRRDVIRGLMENLTLIDRRIKFNNNKLMDACYDVIQYQTENEISGGDEKCSEYTL